jgi:ribonuclease G
LISVDGSDREDRRTRVALLEDDRLMEIYYGHPSQEKLVGNIYKGRVEDVLPGMGSAFIDVGEEKSLFLSRGEISDALLKRRGFMSRKGLTPIQKILRAKQSLILQVRREGIGTKNPQGTTKISLPGRFWVFLPNEDRLGISRRIENVRLERRLQRTAHELKQSGQGLIIRTAAQWASKEDLERDYQYLRDTWTSIEKAAHSASAPQLLYKAMGLVQTILRDRLFPDIEEVVVDSEFFLEKIYAFLDYMHMGEYRDRIRLHHDKNSLFDQYGIESQIREIQSPRVTLHGGGFLVISEAEALTAVDVNTGANVRHRNQQAAILNTNLEAAEEIARQLRLRQISGIIVVDFVDMADPNYVKRLVEKIREELRKDRVPADFIDVTRLGLVEITRKRESESLAGLLENAEFDA